MATTEELIVTARWQGQELERGTRRVADEMKKARSATDVMRDAMIGLSAAMMARQAVAYAEGWTKLNNQLRLVSANLVETRRAVIDVATSTGSSLEGTVALFARMTRATKELGVSEAQRLQAVKTINQAMAVSGATAQESAAALLQLSQAFASNRLAGEEFRAVSEQAPRLMELFAQGLGVGIGKLREMAYEGRVTGQVMLDALAKAAPQVQAEFDKMNVTLGRSMENLRTRFQEWVGLTDQAVGGTKTLAEAVQGLADNLWVVKGTLEAIAALLAVRGMASLLSYMGAGAGMAAGGLVGGALAAGTLGGNYVYEKWKQGTPGEREQIASQLSMGLYQPRGRGFFEATASRFTLGSYQPLAREPEGWTPAVREIESQRQVLEDIRDNLKEGGGGPRGISEARRAYEATKGGTEEEYLDAMNAAQKRALDNDKALEAVRARIAMYSERDLEDAQARAKLAKEQKTEYDQFKAQGATPQQLKDMQELQAKELKLMRARQDAKLATQDATDAEQARREEERRTREWERDQRQQLRAQEQADRAMAASRMRTMQAENAVGQAGMAAAKDLASAQVSLTRARGEEAVAALELRRGTERQVIATQEATRAEVRRLEALGRYLDMTAALAQVDADVERQKQELADNLAQAIEAAMAKPGGEMGLVWDWVGQEAAVEQLGELKKALVEWGKENGDLGAAIEANIDKLTTEAAVRALVRAQQQAVVSGLRELVAAFQGVTGANGAMLDALNAGFGLAESAIAGDPFGMAASGMRLVAGVADLLTGENDKLARRMAEATEATRKITAAVAELAQGAVTGGTALEGVKQWLFTPVLAMFEGYKTGAHRTPGQQAAYEASMREMYGSNWQAANQLTSIQATLRSVGENAPNWQEAIKAAGFQSVADWQAWAKDVFGTTDWVEIATSALNSLNEGLDDLSDAARKAAERATRLSYDVQEMAIRQEAAAAFRSAGGDAGAQRDVYRWLEGQIAGLQASERAALSGLGETKGTQGTGTGAGTGDQAGAGTVVVNGGVPQLEVDAGYFNALLAQIPDQVQLALDNAFALLEVPGLTDDQVAKLDAVADPLWVAQTKVADAFDGVEPPTLPPAAFEVIGKTWDFLDEVNERLEAAGEGREPPKLSPGQGWLVDNAFRVLREVEQAKDRAAAAVELPHLSEAQTGKLEGMLGFLGGIQGTIDQVAAAAVNPALNERGQEVVAATFSFLGAVQRHLDLAAADAAGQIPSLSPGQEYTVSRAFRVLEEIEQAKDAAAVLAVTPGLSDVQRAKIDGAMGFMGQIQDQVNTSVLAANLPSLNDQQLTKVGQVLDAFDQVQGALDRAVANAAVPEVSTEQWQRIGDVVFSVATAYQRASEALAAGGLTWDEAGLGPLPAGVVLRLADVVTVDGTGLEARIRDAIGTIDLADLVNEAIQSGRVDLAPLIKFAADDLKDTVIAAVNDGMRGRKLNIAGKRVP